MNRQKLVLIVDDTEMNRAMLADMLAAEYKIVEASDGRQAIELLYKMQNEISLILLDIVMPKMDGFEVLSVMKKNGWIGRIPVITISSETSSTYIAQAYDLGATDYISRPFDEKTVQRRVRNTIMLYSKQKILESMVAQQIIEKEKNNFLMVEILSNIVEFRNGESGLHVLHIRILTEIFLRKLLEITDKHSLSASRISLIVNASALHDVGKISIPEEILNKPGKLTAEEFEIIKTHSALGAEIMQDALGRYHEDLIQIAYHICRWHHERYDGMGYPDGLEGEDIPIEAQVVALADVYDALVSERVYKPAFSHETALQMILNGECGTFNPVLLECLRQIGPHLETELKNRSIAGVSEANIQELSSQMLQSGPVSSRTLTLLDQERIKYQFFASMSNEIQFEYSYQTDLLTMSEWGAERLGVDVIVEHPQRDERLRKVFSTENYIDLQARLHGVTHKNPIINTIYRLYVKGEERWFKVVARPLWEEETGNVISIIGKFVDIHEEQLRLARLKMQAEQDSLTRLSNHSSAKEMIRRVLNKKGKQFAVVLVDLDAFKESNDRFGHMFGDQVLRYVAQMIQQSVRGGDIAARVGGDEFLLFLEYKGEIEPIVERIFNSLHGEYQSFRVSVSMGVSLSPDNGVRYEELFHKADQALYAAKQDGKNRYYFYNDSMQKLLSVLSPMDN